LITTASGLVYPLRHLTLEVGLEALHIKTQFPAEGLHLIVYLCESNCPVLLRISLSEHVQVYSVQNEYFFHGISKIKDTAFSGREARCHCACPVSTCAVTEAAWKRSIPIRGQVYSITGPTFCQAES
jgi:hypothetical protein